MADVEEFVGITSVLQLRIQLSCPFMFPTNKEARRFIVKMYVMHWPSMTRFGNRGKKRFVLIISINIARCNSRDTSTRPLINIVTGSTGFCSHSDTTCLYQFLDDEIILSFLYFTGSVCPRANQNRPLSLAFIIDFPKC